METLEQIKARLAAAVPGALVNIITNDSPSAQHSLVVAGGHVLTAAKFLRDDAALQLDYCSNVTGVDWLAAELTEKIRFMQVVDGMELEIEEVRKTTRPGFLEVVYHLYSMALKQGPVILRQRTANRTDARVVSLTPVWRGCEFQEREVFDLYGVDFAGHPDQRRILMWDEFKDFPMRKDYVEPGDYEYEPTPHDDVLKKARAHQAQGVKS